MTYLQKQETKSRALATIRAAIHGNFLNGIVSFRHKKSFFDSEIKAFRHTFSLNGVPFKTGWYDAEYYSFLNPTLTDTSTISIEELKLLEWWIERDDTEVDREAPAPRQYLG